VRTGNEETGITLRSDGDRARLHAWITIALVNVVLLAVLAAYRSRTVLAVVTTSADAFSRLLLVLHTATLAIAACTLSIGCVVLAGIIRRPRWGACAASSVHTFLWVLFVVDLKLFVLLGVHLDDRAVVESIGSRGFFAEVDPGAASYSSLAVFAAMVWFANLGSSSALQKWFARSRRERGRTLLLSACAAPVVATVLGWSWCTARAVTDQPALLDALPFFRGISRSLLPQVRATLHYPDPSLPAKALLQNRKNVILIVFESFRADVVTEALTPNLYALSKRDECLSPATTFSASHETAHSMFSLMYGIDAFYMDSAVQQRVDSWPLSTLKQNGYRLLGGSAAHLRGWSHSDSWISRFDRFEEFAEHGNQDDDEDLTRWAEKRIAGQESGQPFLLLLFLHATHHNYYYPPQFEIDRPVLDAGYDHFMGDDKLARFRTEVVNRYRNSVRYTDHLLGRIEAAVERAAGRAEYVLAVTADHAEEFWDRGLLGHSAARLINARTRVPLVICAPGLVARPVAFSGHVDVFPTLFDILGLTPRIDPALYSTGRSLLTAQQPERSLVVVSAAHRSLGDREVVVIDAGRKYQMQETVVAGRFALRNVTGMDDEPVPEAALRSPRSAQERRLDTALSRFVEFAPPHGGDSGR